MTLWLLPTCWQKAYGAPSYRQASAQHDMPKSLAGSVRHLSKQPTLSKHDQLRPQRSD